MGSRRYDSRTTIFSPEGRLYQVEYALEAISHAGISIGILAKNGIVLAAERKVSSKLLEQDTTIGAAEKIYKLDGNDNILGVVAGLNSDASILVEFARRNALSYENMYGSNIPTEILVRRICDIKQGYTQHGGLRPFGVSIIYGGYSGDVNDSVHNTTTLNTGNNNTNNENNDNGNDNAFQLFQSNPSGNYSGWKATSVGANNSTAQTLLKQEYKDNCTLADAVDLAINVLKKTIDSPKLSSEKIEFATLSLDDNGKLLQHIWTPTEIDLLLKRLGFLEEVEE